MIRKEILEQLIVDVALKVLNDPATIDTITERVFAAHERRLADTSVVNILEAERDKNRKALDNMLNAVEQGIITSSTKQRIEEVECEYCRCVFEYKTKNLGYRPWYPSGFVYGPSSKKPLRHHLEYEVKE